MGHLRNAPARIREADHLQPIAGAGGKSGLSGALVQVLALLRCQHYSIHGPEHIRFYELWPLAHLAADPAASSAALGGGPGVAAGTVRKALVVLREKLGAGKDADGAALVALARAGGLAIGEAGDGAGKRVVASRPRPVGEE